MTNIALDPAEETWLLEDAEYADSPLDESATRRANLQQLRWNINSPRKIVLLLSAIIGCTSFSGMLLLIPVYRLIEDALCHAHYQDESDGLIEEMKCKVDEVQSRLAYILGWLGLIGSLVTLLVAFPYGILADRVGRKPTLVLSYLGVCISFSYTPFMLKFFNHAVRRNPYILLTGYLFQLLGGGASVLVSTLYAISADVSTEKDKAGNFLYISFGATVGGLLGPLLAGLLMENFGPWVPVYIVLISSPLLFMSSLLLPETLKKAPQNQRATSDVPRTMTFKKHIRRGLHDLNQSMNMLKNRDVLLILVTFLFQNAAAAGPLAQYISKHFGWRLAEISLLLAPFSLLTLLILSSLPSISKFLVSPRLGYTTFRKDLQLTRLSTMLLAVAAVIQGFSTNVGVFMFGMFVGTFGCADSPLARATLSHYVSAEYTSRLYALIGMVEIIGTFLGGPVIAVLFDTGLRWKGIWRGLPWLYIALLSAIALLALAFVQPPDKKLGEDVLASDEESDNESL